MKLTRPLIISKQALQSTPTLGLPDMTRPFTQTETAHDGSVAQPLPSNYSAQAAELVALTEACKLAKNKSFNIYTDS